MRWPLLLCCIFLYLRSCPWGFHAHKEINYYACFLLPPEMFGFYKKNLEYIREWATKPDQRRYIMEEEGIRHYIDLDHYESKTPIDTLPKKWDEACAIYGEDSLKAHGIIPWHILRTQFALTRAFESRNAEAIVKLSADLGHYIADAHVPLHTTHNYNGQLSGQKGIHALWESRLPELFSGNFDFFMNKAVYISDPQSRIWQVIEESFAAKDTVLRLEKILTQKFIYSKYSYENKGKSVIRVYSKAFSSAYHNALNGMVERRMRKAIFCLASFWYSAWLNAGQPDLVQTPQNETDPNISGVDSNISVNPSVKGLERHQLH